MARVLTLLMVSLLSAGAAFAQTAPPTQASIREVMNRVYGYLLTAAPLRPINGDTGAAVSLDNMPRNVALARTAMRIDTYESGVTYAGMLHATKFTGDVRYRTYVNTQARRARAHGGAHAGQLPDGDLRHVSVIRVRQHLLAAPDALPAEPRRLRLDVRGDDQGESHGNRQGSLRPWIDNYANWVSTRQFRLSDGTFARNKPMPNSVWLDDLYMSVPCLAQMGTLTGDRRYFDDAAKQILQFHSRMFVPAKKPVDARLDPGDESAPGVPLGARQRMGAHGDGRVADGAAEGSSRENAVC